MKKSVRILTAVILCLVCVSAFSFSISANDYGIMPCYDNVGDAELLFTFGDVDQVEGLATRKTGVTSMEGTIDLYEDVDGEWVHIDTFSSSTTGRRLSVTGEFDGVSGTQYKAVFTITAYGTTTETIVVEQISTCQ